MKPFPSSRRKPGPRFQACFRNKFKAWIPAFAGMTLLVSSVHCAASENAVAQNIVPVDQGITLNFQNTDIDMVLKFVSEVTGRVFIKSDAVRGFVTVMAPGRVTQQQALDIFQKVLEVKGFTMVEGTDGMVKVLSRAEAVQSEMEVSVGNGAMSAPSGDRMMSQVVPLRFLAAGELKGQLAPLVSRDGNLVSDDRTNSIVITDMASNIRRLLKLIESLDVRTPQVLIEALIMEVTLTDEFKLGVEWGHQLSFERDGHNFSGSLNQNFSLASIITEGFKYAVVRSDGKLNALLQALSTNKNVNILSTPHIMTLNNQPAMIRVGEEVPILTQTRNIQGGETIRSFDYKSVAIELEVTPRVNQDREVFMKVHPVIKKILGVNAELNAPILANREALTSVIIRDGNTIVIGGLMRDDKASSESKVPILGDIPLLGYFFKRRTSTREKTELLVFITPRVVLNDTEARRVTIDKESESKSPRLPNLLEAKEHYRLGKAHYAAKRYEEAIQAWQQVMEISPNKRLREKAQSRIRKAEKKRPSGKN